MAGDGYIPGSRGKGASFLRPSALACLFQPQTKALKTGLWGCLHSARGKRSHRENNRQQVTTRGRLYAENHSRSLGL